jgi:hypothetical protein
LTRSFEPVIADLAARAKGELREEKTGEMRKSF